MSEQRKSKDVTTTNLRATARAAHVRLATVVAYVLEILVPHPELLSLGDGGEHFFEVTTSEHGACTVGCDF